MANTKATTATREICAPMDISTQSQKLDSFLLEV